MYDIYPWVELPMHPIQYEGERSRDERRRALQRILMNWYASHEDYVRRTLSNAVYKRVNKHIRNGQSGESTQEKKTESDELDELDELEESSERVLKKITPGNTCCNRLRIGSIMYHLQLLKISTR